MGLITVTTTMNSPPAQVVPVTYSMSSSPDHLEVPWFARPPTYSDDEVEMYPMEPLNLIIKKPKNSIEIKEPKLPSDPRRWSRADVCTWVEWTCLSHKLPLPSLDRFLMNGKAVCLMNASMFSARVPLGGKMLYKDFQIRLAKAINCQKVV